jgi:hypothetical protein
MTDCVLKLICIFSLQVLDNPLKEQEEEEEEEEKEKQCFSTLI